MLTIYLFGSFATKYNGKNVQGFRSQTSIALLSYLLLQQKPVSRQKLLDILWGGSDAKKPRTELRRILSNLRKLYPHCIETEKELVWIQFSRVDAFDVQDFTHLIQKNNLSEWQKALGLYQGPLLDGLELEKGSPFNSWLNVQRSYYQDQFVRTLIKVVEHFVQIENFVQGLPAVRKWRLYEPYSELACSQEMRLLAYSEDYRGAISVYTQFCTLVADDLGMSVSPQMVRLSEQIKAATRPRPNNISRQPNRFIGRISQQQQAQQQIKQPDSRLLTITGAGGIGKTRLGIEIALSAVYDKAGLFSGGVYFVPLEAVKSGEGLFLEIAKALGVPFAVPTSLLPKLINHLRDKEVLLFLDNFEHLMAHAATINQLIQALPRLTLLITSRVRLGLQAEQVLILEGLTYPPPHADNPLDSYEAVQLFQQFAQHVRLDFVLSAENQVCVTKICRLVEGMPLGIELAANWVGVMSCTEIALEIERNIDFLNTMQQDLPDRHHSLRAAFDYSWHLLTNEEKNAIVQLSIFRNGFDRHAADVVTGAPLAILRLLHNKSLIRHNAQSGRYDIHDLLRQFALEKLEACPDSKTKIFQQHSDYYLNFLATRECGLHNQQQNRVVAEIEPDLENMFDAVCYAVSHNQIACLELAIDALVTFLDLRGWYQMGDNIFAFIETGIRERANETVQHQIVLGLALRSRAWFAMRSGRFAEGVIWGQEAAVLLRVGVGDSAEKQRAKAEFTLGALQLWQGHYAEAMDYYQRSLQRYQMIEDQWGMATSLLLIAQAYHASSQLEAAKTHGERCLTLYQAVGDQRGIGNARWTLGRIARYLEQFTEAEMHFLNAKLYQEEIGDLRQVATSLCNLGAIAVQQNQTQSAATYFHDALQKSEHIQATPVSVEIMLEVADWYCRRAKFEQSLIYATLVATHDAAANWHRYQANEMIKRLSPQLSSQVVAEAQFRAQSTPFHDFVAQLFRELDAGGG